MTDDVGIALRVINALPSLMAERRAKQRLRQVDAAAALGINQQAWSRYERGQSFPHLPVLLSILHWLRD